LDHTRASNAINKLIPKAKFDEPEQNKFLNIFQEVLDHTRASNAINKLIPKAKRLWFLPKNNLPVCCGFQTMLIRWCGYYGELDEIHVKYNLGIDTKKYLEL
jgi:hypothetical protein